MTTKKEEQKILLITWHKSTGNWQPYLESSSAHQVRVYIPKDWKVKYDHSEEN